MEFRVRLVHADTQRRVVRVQAFEGERCLGSALGEATSAEEAEDRARDRLRQRLEAPSGPLAGPKPEEPAPAPTLSPAPAAAVAPSGSSGRSPSSGLSEASAPSPSSGRSGPSVPSGSSIPSVPYGISVPSGSSERSPSTGLSEASALPPSAGVSAPSAPWGRAGSDDRPEPPADPDDWSADLNQLDQLLGSLGWGREEERIYLQRLFGQPSRGKLTRYADLMVLRRALEALPPGSEPHTALLPLPRAELLSQSDDLLARLGWPTERARQWLEQQFAVTSRQRLSDEELLAFNLLLEGELLGQGEFGEADHSVGSPSASPDSSTS
ncbi:MAG: hypothetical protein ACK59A_11085 [Cyanobacteriota bacterium]|jgi:hypothetical protein